MTFAQLRLLINNMDAAVNDLEKIFSVQSLDFPSLNTPFAESPAEQLAQTSDAIKAIDICIASAYQLLSTVRHPFGTLCDASSIVRSFFDNCS